MRRLLLLRFRRVIGGVCRLQRLGFQGFLRGTLIAAAIGICTGTAVRHQNADEHQSCRSHGKRGHQRTPAHGPAATADHRPAAADERAVVRSRGRARAVPSFATRAGRTRNRHARMTASRMRSRSATALGGSVCLFLSCILFAKHLDRNSEQRRFGSVAMWTMPDGRFASRHARMTPLRRLLLVKTSVDRFSHHVLPRIART